MEELEVQIGVRQGRVFSFFGDILHAVHGAVCEGEDDIVLPQISRYSEH